MFLSPLPSPATFLPPDCMVLHFCKLDRCNVAAVHIFFAISGPLFPLSDFLDKMICQVSSNIKTLCFQFSIDSIANICVAL